MILTTAWCSILSIQPCMLLIMRICHLQLWIAKTFTTLKNIDIVKLRSFTVNERSYL